MKDMGVENLPEAPTGIMETIPKVDLPQKTGSARSFLVEALKKETHDKTKAETTVEVLKDIIKFD